MSEEAAVPRSTPIDLSPPADSRLRPRVILLLILLAGAALRLGGLDHAPPAVSQDEAVNAYDAFCLWQTGKDHYGTAWPVFFRSFGDYHAGMPIYLQIPFQIVLGMNAWSARLPDALLGSATVLLLFLLVRPYYGLRVALWAAAFLAVSPWHIHLSRLSFGVAASFCFTIFALWVLDRQVRGGAEDPPVPLRDNIWLVVAGAALGVTPWTYHAMLVFVPTLLFVAAVVGWRRTRSYAQRRGGPAAIAATTLGFVLGMAPYLYELSRAHDRALGRASAEIILKESSGLLGSLRQVAHNYFVHFTPSFLFLEGDHSLMESVSGYGQLHVFSALLVPIGLYRVWRRRREERFGRLVLGWLLISPLPAALTHIAEDSGHCLRSAGGIFAYDILAALGLDVLLSAARRMSLASGRRAAVASIFVVAGCTAYFGYLFFVRYPVDAARDYLTGWVPLLKEVARREAQYDDVIVTNLGSGYVGVLYLFWSATDPETFLKSEPKYTASPGSESLMQFGKFLFVPSQVMDQIRLQVSREHRVLVAERCGIPVQGVLLNQYKDVYGNPFVNLYDVRLAPAASRSSLAP